MVVGKAIVEWASDLPGWQRAALRMLTEAVNVTDGQIDTLAAIALLDGGHEPPFGDPMTLPH